MHTYACIHIHIQGDLSTLPESEALDIKSLISLTILGRVKIAAEKGTYMYAYGCAYVCVYRLPTTASACSSQMIYMHMRTCAHAHMRTRTRARTRTRTRTCTCTGTDYRERVEFPNEWRVGDEHGLEHNGLQGDGNLLTRLDWKAEKADGQLQAHCALIKVSPCPHARMHACMHAHVHAHHARIRRSTPGSPTYIHTYIHTYIRTYVHTNIRTCIHMHP